MKRDEVAEERVEVDARGAKDYRGLVAQVNCMCQDRLDISFASGEVSKSMVAPV